MNQPESVPYVLMLGAFLLTASWYGPGFDGNTAASGEVFNQDDLTVAHRDFPFGTLLLLKRGDNQTVVRVNDRGPYEPDAVAAGRLEPHPIRDLDLSREAFSRLAPLDEGIIDVEVTIIRYGRAPMAGRFGGR